MQVSQHAMVVTNIYDMRYMLSRGLLWPSHSLIMISLCPEDSYWFYCQCYKIWGYGLFCSSLSSGHYAHNPIQYRAVISNFLEKAMSVHLHKIRQLGERAHTHDEISELICDLQKVAVNSNQSLRRVATGPCDHFFLPSSAPYQSNSNNSDPSSSQEEQRERSSFRPLQPTSINAHSVLGQFLFDSCVPKNIEGWDIRFAGCLNGQPYATSSSRKNSNLGFKKRFFRSRLWMKSQKLSKVLGDVNHMGK